MSKKGRQLRCILAGTLSICMTLVSSVYADNTFVSEELISSSVDEVTIQENTVLDRNNIIWSDASGRYSYTYDGAVAGKKYNLYAVSGIYESLEYGMTDDMVKNLVYINQITAEGTSVSFAGFSPSKEVASTVILGGDGMTPRIVGYLQGDIFRADEFILSDSVKTGKDAIYPISIGTTKEEFIATLPTRATARVVSDYFDGVDIPVAINWRDIDNFDSSTPGYSFQIAADVVPDTTGDNAKYAGLIKTYQAQAVVQEEGTVVSGITVTKSKAQYTVGATLDTDDIYVRIVYYDGTMKDVPASTFTVDASNVNMTEAGVYSINVSYTSDINETFTGTVRVYVHDSGVVDRYMVSYETFGGGYIASDFVEKDTLLTLPTSPEKRGFTFGGWHTDRECEQVFDDTAPITRDITLFAKWNIVADESSYVTGIDARICENLFRLGETLTNGMINVEAVYSDGTSKELVNTEYSTNLSSIDQTVAGNKQLVVTYADESSEYNAYLDFSIVDDTKVTVYTVTFEAADGFDRITRNVIAGNKIETPDVKPSKSGCEFAGWFYEGKLWNFEKDVVKSDTTLTAKFATVRTSANGDIIAYIEQLGEYEYTGAAITPLPVVIDSMGNTLKRGTDYTLAYKDNRNISSENIQATITVKAKGNYEGSITIPFSIVCKDISGVDTTVKIEKNYAYKENGYTPVPTVKVGNKVIKNKLDYVVSYEKLATSTDETGTAVEAPLKTVGYYKVNITGINNYSGVRTEVIRIVPTGMTDLKSAVVDINKDYKKNVYTGNPIKIASLARLVIAKRTVSTSDYTIIYPEDCTSVGKVKVIFKAKETSSKYYGEKEFIYDITGLPISSAKVIMNANKYSYMDPSVTSAVSSIKYKVTRANYRALVGMSLGGMIGNEVTLREGRDYVVSYSAVDKAGSAVITVNAIGGFTGKNVKKVPIAKIPLNNSNIKATIEPSVIQSKKGAIPRIVVKYESSTGDIALKEGVDYTVTYSNNKDISTDKKKAKAVVKGKGNYSGSISLEYIITPKAITSSDIRVVVENTLYKSNSKAQYKPTIAIYDGDTALKINKDYSVDYSKCVTNALFSNGSKGGYVIINAKGSYTGKIVKYYKVVNISIADKKCVATIDDQRYSGKPITFDLNTDSGKNAFHVTYTDGDSTISLIPGCDFRIVSYKTNIKAGTASVVISGIGEYCGNKTIKFKIVKQNIQ